MADFKKLKYERDCDLVVRLLGTQSGKRAIIEGLQRTTEGRQIVKSEFGITIVDKAAHDAKPIVAICIPTHKQPENETGTALDKMVQVARKDAHIILRPGIASSVVHWVRNQLLSMLYKDKIEFDYVLFMDDDMVPQPNALSVLLDRKVDLIGAVCTVRQDPPLPNVRHFNAEELTFRTADIDRPGTWNVGAVGTGFMLISRKVLDAVGDYTLSQAYAKKYLGMSDEVAAAREASELGRVANDHNKFWFEFLKHPRGEGELGEDISFCFKARECGFDIYADSTIKVGHIGNYGYSIEDYWYYREEAQAKGLVVNLVGPKKPLLESNDTISVLCPTRGRPESMARLFHSIVASASEPVELLFYVDDDDTDSFPMVQQLQVDALATNGHISVKQITGPRITLSDCWNQLAKKATGSILFNAGDDLLFKTNGWDTAVKDQFARCADKILFVHGNDGHWGASFGTHGFVHRKWVETIGYFIPPYFSSDYGDTWLNEVANALGRRVFLPLDIEHLHPLWGKAEWDKTHQERLERHAKDGVEELYRSLAHERAANVAKLREVIANAVHDKIAAEGEQREAEVAALVNG